MTNIFLKEYGHNNKKFKVILIKDLQSSAIVLLTKKTIGYCDCYQQQIKNIASCKFDFICTK